MKPKPLFPLLLVLVILAGCAVLSWIRPSLETKAGRGYAEAQYDLGKCYYYGIGMGQSDAQAAKWFRCAALQGHAKAQTALGMMYLTGSGMHQSYREALTWLRKAAIQGQAVAQNQVGILCAEGKGTRQDLELAIRWFELAALQGYPPASHNLCLAKAAKRTFIAQITTRAGKTYRNAQVQKVESDGITVRFSPPQGGVGVARLAFKDLSQPFQAQYGFSPANDRKRLPAGAELGTVVLQAL